MGGSVLSSELQAAVQARWKDAGLSKKGFPQIRCTVCDGASPGGTTLASAKTKQVFHLTVQCEELSASSREEDQNLRKQLAPYVGMSLVKTVKDRGIMRTLLAGRTANGDGLEETEGPAELEGIMNFRGENEEPAAGRGKRLLRCDFGEGLQAMLEVIGAIGLDELSGRRSTLAYWEKVRVSLEKSYPERKIPTTETLRKHYQTAETVWSEQQRASLILAGGGSVDPDEVDKLLSDQSRAEEVFTRRATVLFNNIQVALEIGASHPDPISTDPPHPSSAHPSFTHQPATPRSGGIVSVMPPAERAMTLEARKAKMEAKARKRARREEKQREDREWKRVQREMARKKDEALLSALESVQQQNVAISGLLNKMADKFM